MNPARQRPAAPQPARRQPAFERLPLLMLGFLALFVGTGAGLARLGWPMPAVAGQAAAWHGPLMVCGFFGVVIALERAVALGRAWAYAAPLFCGLGTLALLAGSVRWGALATLLGSGVLLAATAAVLQRQREAFVVLLTLAAGCWVVGNAAWAWGAAVHEVLVWWVGFLVLTIAGERLELSRFMPASRPALRGFALIVAGSLLALLASAPVFAPWDTVGPHALGGCLLALAVWLLRHDIARRTVRQTGLTRYIAVCLLSGYVWLAVGGGTLLVFGLSPATASYDAAVHALLLGFVFAMVFGHAPIVFPAVLRVSVPYRVHFYLPLLLLHASLALRLLGDAVGSAGFRRHGALGSALALALFVLTMLVTVLTSRPRAVSTPAA